MGRPRTDKIIAAVVGGPYDQVAGFEYVERGLQYGCRQMRAVAVEGDDPLLARDCKVIEHESKACGEALARLKYDAHCFGHRARQVVNVGREAHNSNFQMIECLR